MHAAKLTSQTHTTNARRLCADPEANVQNAVQFLDNLVKVGGPWWMVRGHHARKCPFHGLRSGCVAGTPSVANPQFSQVEGMGNGLCFEIEQVNMNLAMKP